MRNYAIAFGIALALTGTTYAFGGDGCPRTGECTQEMRTQSRPSKTTIMHGKGASQKNFRYSFKRQIKPSRVKTREQKSQLLDKRFYRNSRHRTEIKPVRIETQVQKNLRLWKAKRMAR